jgi:hypothetical protein
MILERQLSIFHETVITVHHAALDKPVEIMHPDPVKAEEEARRILILLSKTLIYKFQTVSRRSRGNMLNIDQQRAYDQLNYLRKYIRRDTPFTTFQDKMSDAYTLMGDLLPQQTARTYASQAAKMDFIDQVAIISVEDFKQSGNVHI